jgi:glutathione S-transferase
MLFVMRLELISFKICPFVQRAVITLLHKQVEHTVTYIDLASPPDWFKTISPFGKVPLLKVDDRHVIFESAIIDEYLNEAFPGKLLPDDPITRALDRSWIEFGTSLTLEFSGLIHSTDEATWQNKLAATQQKLQWLENKLGNGPWFNGESFSLVDIAYAPLFMRSNLLKLADQLYPANQFPKTSQWEKQLLTLPELPRSVVVDFDDILITHIGKKAPYAAKQLKIS